MPQEIQTANLKKILEDIAAFKRQEYCPFGPDNRCQKASLGDVVTQVIDAVEHPEKHKPVIINDLPKKKKTTTTKAPKKTTTPKSPHTQQPLKFTTKLPANGTVESTTAGPANNGTGPEVTTSATNADNSTHSPDATTAVPGGNSTEAPPEGSSQAPPEGSTQAPADATTGAPLNATTGAPADVTTHAALREGNGNEEIFERTNFNNENEKQTRRRYVSNADILLRFMNLKPKSVQVNLGNHLPLL